MLANCRKALLQEFQKELPGFGDEAILRMAPWTMAQGSYSEKVSIWDNGTQHEFNVTLTGFDQNAASLSAQAALVTLYMPIGRQERRKRPDDRKRPRSGEAMAPSYDGH
jgi:hypothetical protein